MLRLQTGFLNCLVISAAGLLAQDRAAQITANNPDSANKLPVKRVVLYKNGVGYFEHLGGALGNQDVAISFTSGQLNDVLKSLTVLDLNGGRITGVAYGSSAPVDRQLGDLRLPLGEKTSLTEFLGSLRGARVEVRSGPNTITGRLLSVERKTRMGNGATLEVDYVALITDNGEVKTTELSPQFSFRLLERGLPGKVDRYLDLVSAGREPDVRRMVVSSEGTGQRSIFVSYISEVPVWKATYRIVLNPKTSKSPLLQGWAIVDNTVGQDWDKVQLSLVAGAPQSFIQYLSQPYYSRRPVVPLPESVNPSPQTYEATLMFGAAQVAGRITDPAGGIIPSARIKAYDSNGGLVGETTANSMGEYEFRSLPDGQIRLEAESQGFRRTVTNLNASSSTPLRNDLQLQVGNVTETVEVSASAVPMNAQNSSVNTTANRRSVGNNSALGRGAELAVNGRGVGRVAGNSGGSGFGGGVGGGTYVGDARSQAQAAALAQELGDLFEYKLKEPITIRKNQSALVPIVQSSITAEKVSVWNEQARLPRPQRALWLENTTGLTLDGGSFSVLEEETFAGEGIFDPIRPSEKRLVSYAMDLALNVSSKIGSDAQRVSKIRIAHGVMTSESEIREKKTYTFRNADASSRDVIIEHPVRPGFELRGDTKPIETTSAWMRFRLPVASKQTAALVVEEARTLPTTFALNNLTADQVAVFVRQQSINKPIEEALRKILAQKEVVSNLEDQKTEREEERDKIFDDQQRLRENMKALKGSAEEKALLQRYTQQLNEQESRLEVLRKEIKKFEASEAAAQAALNKMIQDLSFDVRL